MLALQRMAPLWRKRKWAAARRGVVRVELAHRVGVGHARPRRGCSTLQTPGSLLLSECWALVVSRTQCVLDARLDEVAYVADLARPRPLGLEHPKLGEVPVRL